MEKKVVFLIPTLSGGGAERAVSNISINMSKKVQQEIILFGRSSKVVYPHSAAVKYWDRIPHTNILNKLYSFFWRIHKARSLRKDCSNPTVISFLEYPNIINILTKKHGKTIVSVRNHMSTQHRKGFKASIWNVTIKYLYGKADQIIVVSEEIGEDLVNNYGLDKNKIKVIYNSYPIEDIQTLASDEVEDDYVEIFNNPVIITVGRFNKQKGQWHLIRAFSKVKKEVPNAKLVFLGEGQLKNYYLQLAKDLGVDNDVYFLGFQRNPFKYISKSKIFALTSIHEGFPNALAEAMACGIPIVSTDCLSGPREILAPEEFNKESINYDFNKERFGVLLPVCDGTRYNATEKLTKEETVMADRLMYLLKDKEMSNYFSEQSLKRIRDFDIKTIIKEWESII